MTMFKKITKSHKERLLAINNLYSTKFKKLVALSLFVFVFFVLPENVFATTYTVCSSGCDAVLIQDVFNNNDLAPGDIIEAQADTVGGSKTFPGKIAPGTDDSGSFADYVYIRGRSGDTITLDANGASDVLDMNTDNWLHISNFTLTGGTNARIIIWGGCDNLVLDNLIFSGNGNGIESGYGINARGTNNAITVSNSSFLSNHIGINYYYTQSNFVISDTIFDVSGGTMGIRIGATTIGTSLISDVEITGGSDDGIILTGVGSVSGSLSISNSTISGVADVGVIVNNSQNITLTDINASNSNTGFSVSDSSNVTFNNCVSHTNALDGFSHTGTNIHDITYNSCIAYENGIGGILSAGDGFTSHIYSYNLFFNNCIAYNNANTGFAMVHSTHGYIYNSVSYNNGNEGHSRRGGFYLYVDGLNPETSDTWKIKNSISENSYTRELLLTSDSPPENLDYNMYFRSADPTGSEFSKVADEIMSWATYSATREPHSNYTSPIFTNGSGLFNMPTDFQLSEFSSAIDAGTNLGLSTDYVGNSIYGTPDIGAYEYQPPYTMRTDEPDIASDVRVYGDGKFRNTQATGGTTANLAIVPTSNDTTQWLDVDISTWETSETYRKEWAESSTTITGNVDHVIGDLAVNTYYNISVDSTLGQDITGATCIGGFCKSDAQGEITFTYTGTYSTHTFAVVQNTDSSDDDDLPDWWEEQYFPGALTVLNRNEDYDYDGYNNYQEYLNSTNPTVKDVPGGPGYIQPAFGFQWPLFLPAIIGRK